MSTQKKIRPNEGPGRGTQTRRHQVLDPRGAHPVPRSVELGRGMHVVECCTPERRIVDADNYVDVDVGADDADVDIGRLLSVRSVGLRQSS